MPKGYSLDALANTHFPAATGPLGSTNLDTLTGRDNAGLYLQNSDAAATPANNYPTTQAGVLEVFWHGANGAGNVLQRYTTYSSNRVFIRSQTATDGRWNTWDEILVGNQLYNRIFPVGSIYLAVNANNPNSLFPGTTWVQLTENRVIRISNTTAVGTTDGQISSRGGSDTITLSGNQLPAHTHEIPVHSHTIAHTHSVPAHAHTMAHTHTIAPHSHGATTSIAANGAHTHTITIKGNNNDGTAAPKGNNGTGGTGTNNTSEAGSHAHTATTTIANSATLTTSGSSAGNTGTQAAMTTGGSSAANSGGSTAGMQTGNGPGTSAGISIRNACISVAFWYRTA